jgi:hypothetical protein
MASQAAPWGYPLIWLREQHLGFPPPPPVAVDILLYLWVRASSLHMLDCPAQNSVHTVPLSWNFFSFQNQVKLRPVYVCLFIFQDLPVQIRWSPSPGSPNILEQAWETSRRKVPWWRYYILHFRKVFWITVSFYSVRVMWLDFNLRQDDNSPYGCVQCGKY